MNEKSPVNNGNFVNDEDYFIIKLHKLLPDNTRKPHIIKYIKYFKHSFQYNYKFNRDNIEKILRIKKSRASEIITLLLDCNLIKPSNPTNYKFKK